MTGAARGPRPPPRGVALVIVLLLLLAVTVLGVGGIATATLELQSAANHQYHERAFEAAEYAVARALSAPAPGSAATPTAPAKPACGAACVTPATGDPYDYAVYHDPSSAGAPGADGGHSLGSGIASHHYVVEAVGNSHRGARSEQALGYALPGADDD